MGNYIVWLTTTPNRLLFLWFVMHYILPPAATTHHLSFSGMWDGGRAVPFALLPVNLFCKLSTSYTHPPSFPFKSQRRYDLGRNFQRRSWMTTYDYHRGSGMCLSLMSSHREIWAQSLTASTYYYKGGNENNITNEGIYISIQHTQVWLKGIVGTVYGQMYHGGTYDGPSSSSLEIFESYMLIYMHRLATHLRRGWRQQC